MADKKQPPKRPNGSGGSNGNGNDQDPNNRARQVFNRSWVWIILIIVFFFGYRVLFSPTSNTENMVGLNEVAEWVSAGGVTRLVVQGEEVTVELDGNRETV